MALEFGNLSSDHLKANFFLIVENLAIQPALFLGLYFRDTAIHHLGSEKLV